MKLSILFSLLMTTFLFTTACNAPAASDTKTDAAKMATTTATVPDYEIAPQEYATMSESAIQKTTSNDIDGLAPMLADDVEFYYPDGDQNTRTKFIGKPAVIKWMKESFIAGGMKSSSSNAFNIIPVKANKKLNAGSLSGIQVICFFTRSATYNNGNTVSVRMNAVFHFNDNKLIDRVINYYDRTPFIKASGKNILDAAKK